MSRSQREESCRRFARHYEREANALAQAGFIADAKRRRLTATLLRKHSAFLTWSPSNLEMPCQSLTVQSRETLIRSSIG